MEQNPRADRKTIEKNRRNHMKALYSKLHSLVPHRPSMVSLSLSLSMFLSEAMSLPDQLDEASTYIKKLEKELEEMKEKRDSKMMRAGKNPNSRMMSTSSSAGMMIRSPQIEIHEMGSALEVVLITGLDCQPIFNEIIRLIHEEEAEVVNASFSTVGDTVFHTIHCKVGESSGFACGAARIAEKLKKSFYDAGPF
ncbi:hypothetical protein RHSIM_Rhsim02G0131400 [Rhododendron simsii]|uniref:BHLH domain-containing protein n=1 Tax=Rhododendron simsii TaxID=118357 RepID=A0A834HF59_RHOSS|nr:hypothetical protein RHSIM_Rhsim02G0131400 [Rhododendron simsii]